MLGVSLQQEVESLRYMIKLICRVLVLGSRLLVPWCQVYRILMEETCSVQPLSCDEAFMDVTGLGDPEAIAGKLRAQIEADTGCTASAGIGPNMLLARLATKRAKPNGQFLINSVQVGAHRRSFAVMTRWSPDL